MTDTERPVGTERHKLITDEAMAATEAAALAAARQMGRGDRNGADKAAVEAMRVAMDAADLSGTRRPCCTSASGWATPRRRS